MKRRNRIIAYTALALLAGVLSTPLPAFAQSANVQQMSVEQLQSSLQALQSGQHSLSPRDARREMREIRRELRRRQSGEQQQQEQQQQERQQKKQQKKQQQQQQQAQPQQAPQTPAATAVDNNAGNVNREARQYLRATGNVAQLNDRQLIDAIRTGRNLLQQRNLRGRLQNQVQQTVQAATAERQRRQAAAQPAPQQPPASGIGDDGNVNREARQYLRATGNVAQLNDRQLIDAIRTGRNLLQQRDLRGRLQNQVQQTVHAATVERQRRQAAAQPPAGSNADAAARRLLDDNRPASALRDPALRKRLDEARRVMGDRSLSRRLFRQVRRMAQQDSTELRERVARRDENRAERREDRQDARQLLADQRPVSRLSDRELRARIASARDLLSGNSLRPREQVRIEEMLREARREARRRLIAERQRRRNELARKRRLNEVIIRIPSGVFEQRDNITAAEADDALLERQLVAPPTRRIDRRYSRSELRSRPGIRDFMPAIEVDTIRFGFNEAFVREEEIPQLERIGEIIERIVAANPDEVFLIEGHTDAVGSNAYNLALSQKRADAVSDAMLEYFNIDAANIETIGYGEDFLKIETDQEEAENRRVTIRRITPLLSGGR